jgi:hypothetical protein
MIPGKASFEILAFCVGASILIVFSLMLRHSGAKAERERNAAEIATCQADKATLVRSLNQVNAIAFTAKQGEAEQQLKADHAVKAAEVDKADYLAHIENLAKDLKRAKRTPTCRAQLESELCVALE